VPETIEIQLKKGVLTLCVLALLNRHDSYAYEIASTLSDAIDMGEGTIYPLMRRMQSDGQVETYLVESPSGPSRKYYRLTDAGRRALEAQTTEWRAFAQAVESVLDGPAQAAASASTTDDVTAERGARRGLVGMPTAAAADIASDYEIHFEDGLAAGRTEAEVAAALGDPDRLARELRAEAGAQRWHQEKNPSAAVAAIFAVLGLGAISILFLLPILMSVVGVLFGLFMAAIGVFIGGGAIMVAGPFAGFPGGPLAAILARPWPP